MYAAVTFCISYGYTKDTYLMKVNFRSLLMWKVHKTNFNTHASACTFTHMNTCMHVCTHTITQTHTKQGKGQTEHYHKIVHLSINHKL